MLSLNSKIKDVMKHPVGNDIIHKVILQANLNPAILNNPVVKNLKIKSLQKYSKRWLGDDFFVKVLRLLNSEHSIPKADDEKHEKTWWKQATFYQIYPRSFKDSDGDGIGDIRGIIESLDYLQDLGIDALWLSPIYDSPNDDNGYDIRDYRAIMSEFGSMEDFDTLLNEVHGRGMRLIMDLVVNHTSDEHAWFQEALRDPDSKYRDYYFIHEGDETETPPNNWVSFFSGSAWKHFDKENVWALHLFSEKQMDLNWDNSDVRDDVVDMVTWWFEKGVDGFRLDVVNYISKNRGLVDGNTFIGDLMEFTGIEEYFYGENLHKYLNELNQRAFQPYGAFSVGELPGIGMEMGKLLTGDYRHELDMFFNFDHLETPGHVRFDDYLYDLRYYKKYIVGYQNEYKNHYWMSLFFENHDNPRMISKVNPDPKYRFVIGKLLATLQLTLRGTPFIYQGQELGRINTKFDSIHQIKDVESINKYNELIGKGISNLEAYKIVMAGSRDHARTPMPWSHTENAGFTSGTPWITLDDDYKEINVLSSLEDETSVLNYYKSLIALRQSSETLIYGRIEFHHLDKENILAYTRHDKDGAYYVQMNLSSENVGKPNESMMLGDKVLSNYSDEVGTLRPYEATIYKIR